MKQLVWIIGFLFLLSGCSGEEEAAVLETSVPPTAIVTIAPEATALPVVEVEVTAVVEAIEETAVFTPTPLPTSAPVGLGGTITTTVVITASDGLPLHATHYAPVSSSLRPAVILLHMLGDNRRAWTRTGLPQELINNGRYHVLTLDMRGHGETLGLRDWEMAEEDLQLVWEWLVDQPSVDGEKTAVIGGSIGANMALIAGADNEAISTVVLLSPGLDYRGVTTADALEKWGKRPLFIVASENDEYSAESSLALAEQAQGEVELQMYQWAGHGTRMFSAESDLTILIAEWLAAHWLP